MCVGSRCRLTLSNRCNRRSWCSAEIGLGLTAFGFLFTFLGILLFFDRGLLAMGNVSVLAEQQRHHAAPCSLCPSTLTRSLLPAYLLRTTCLPAVVVPCGYDHHHRGAGDSAVLQPAEKPQGASVGGGRQQWRVWRAPAARTADSSGVLVSPVTASTDCCCCCWCVGTPQQGSAFYLSGAVLVIVGWTMIGLVVEAYGFWLLFCEFIPTVLTFSRRVPFLSKVLDMPALKLVS